MLLLLGAAPPGPGAAGPPWSYTFEAWDGPALDVAWYVPRRARANSPILIVIPGASRDAPRFHASWLSFAHRFKFAVITLGAPRARFPTEHDYNAGRVLAPDGELHPENEWLFSAVDPLFEDFKARFGFTTERYHLFGHSAGGGFVHRMLLFKPEAKMQRAVAANPAFVTLPDSGIAYPFGLSGAPISERGLERWLASPLTILLGGDDTGPRKQPLSNGRQARAQGPHVLARGKLLFERARAEAERRGVPFRWRLRIAEGVGHDNRAIAPYALEPLFAKSED